VLTLVVPIWLLVIGLRWLLREHKQTALTGFVLGGIPILIAAAVGSIAIQASRYLSFLAPFVLLLIAIGILEIWPRWWGRLLIVVYVVTVVAGLWTQIAVHDRAPGMNTYAHAIQSQQKVGDIVVVRGSFGGGESAALQFEANHASALPPVVDMFSDYSVGNLETLRLVPPATTVDQLLTTHQRVWFFDDTYAPNPLLGLEQADTITSQQLGVDKERQPLTLYLVTK